MSGSPDRLVVTHGLEPSGTSSRRAALATAAFDFKQGSWQQLPDAPWVPTALPDGLAGVGLECGASASDDEGGNFPCQVEVATLRWDDKEWHHQQVSNDAVLVHEGGFIQPLGARGPWAYFQVAREDDAQILRVNADGDVARCRSRRPEIRTWSGSNVCCASRRVGSTRSGSQPRRTAPAGFHFYDSMRPGPVQHLDDEAASPQWQDVADTNPLAWPAPGKFVCGAHGSSCSSPTGRRRGSTTSSSRSRVRRRRHLLRW